MAGVGRVTDPQPEASPPPRNPLVGVVRTTALVTFLFGLLLLVSAAGAFDGVRRDLARRYCETHPTLMEPVASGPHTSAVRDQIEGCAALVERGTATLTEVATYTTELANAAEDGRIDDAESLVLERTYDTLFAQ